MHEMQGIHSRQLVNTMVRLSDYDASFCYHNCTNLLIIKTLAASVAESGKLSSGVRPSARYDTIRYEMLL